MVTKKAILQQILDELESKITDLQQSIEQSIESRDSDSKSSMGDKYETGRAMIQIEIEKAKVELGKAVQQKHEILKIDPEKVYQEVGFGSLVVTTKMRFLIAFAYGKIDCQNQQIYIISLASPLGRAMEGRKSGEKFQFQSGLIDILQVY